MSTLGDTAGLTRWMDQNVDGGLVGELSTTLIAGGRSNPTYRLTDQGSDRQWILRRPPHGHVLPTAHSMARENRVITALADSAVPVPHVVGFSADPQVIGAEFYVMDMLPGITLRTQDDTARLSEDQRERLSENLVSLLVDLHRIDPAEVGLSDWGRPDGFLQRQLNRWGEQWASSQTVARPETGELETWLRANLPTSTAPGIVHGDFKLDNVMVSREDPTRIIGLLDWEMSTLGDPLTDLGILSSFWDQDGEFYNPITAGATALPGFGTRAELVDRYARARGIEVADLTWYRVFADYKIAIILEGIHARHLQGHTQGDDFADVGEMVGPLFARALDIART